MSKNYVAVDTETLGVQNGSIVLSIGAVRFSEKGLNVLDYEHMTTEEITVARARDEFYAEITVASAGSIGLTFDNDTMAWWMQQEPDARVVVERCLRGEAQDIRQVLGSFKAWLEQGDGFDEIWAWHSPFDMGMIKSAYSRLGVRQPWDYRKEFCAYTLAKATGLPKPSTQGTKHNSLDDAKWCARYVTSCKQFVEQAKDALLRVNLVEANAEVQRTQSGAVGRPTWGSGGAGGVAGVLRDQWGHPVVGRNVASRNLAGRQADRVWVDEVERGQQATRNDREDALGYVSEAAPMDRASWDSIRYETQEAARFPEHTPVDVDGAVPSRLEGDAPEIAGDVTLEIHHAQITSEGTQAVRETAPVEEVRDGSA